MGDSIIDLENYDTRSVRLLAKDRVLMFLNEYYFSRSKSLTLLRIFGGPLLIYIGISFLNAHHDHAFAYFSLIYGSYMIVKPLVWILFRWDSFKTVDVTIEVQHFIMIKDEFSESKILFEGFNEITRKRWYYILYVSKANRMHLPFYLFSDKQRAILDQHLTH